MGRAGELCTLSEHPEEFIPQNHRIAWVGGDLKDHPFLTHCHWQSCPPTSSGCPRFIQHGLELLQGWSTTALWAACSKRYQPPPSSPELLRKDQQIFENFVPSFLYFLIHCDILGYRLSRCILVHELWDLTSTGKTELRVFMPSITISFHYLDSPICLWKGLLYANTSLQL